MKKPIGIFDSGFGGLTVMSEIIKLLPNENIVYFGDTAHVPYGSKSKAAVTKFSLQIASFLMKQNIKILVVACNTASAFALASIQNKLRIPVIGVIIPGAKAANEISKKGRIGIIGTEGTIKSSAYPKEIRKLNKKISVFSQSCPLFVPLVEEGWTNHRVTSVIAAKYLAPLAKKGIDTLVLGCTHYPLIKNVIKNAIDNRIKLVDSAQATAQAVADTLNVLGIKEKYGTSGKFTFFVSDAPDKFKFYGKKFLGHPVKNVKKITLE